MGGTGATLVLVFMFCFLAKSQEMRAVGKAAIVPVCFAVNEPLLFAAPIILNPYIPDLFHKRHSLRVPVFFLLFLFHPFSGGLLFLSSSYHMFFPAFCHFFRPGT